MQNGAPPAKRQKRVTASTNGIDSGTAAIDDVVAETDEELSADEEDDDDDAVDEQDDDDDDFQGPAQPKKKAPSGNKPRRKASSVKANGAGRQSRSTAKTPRYADGDEDEHEGAQTVRSRGDDFGVAGDNNLFSE